MLNPTYDSIIVLDYGGQTAQLITRRIREIGVYSELFAWDTDVETIKAHNPKGIILSGGPYSVYEAGAPILPGYLMELGIPIFGICYGMQLLTHALGGVVSPAQAREYGPAEIDTIGGQAIWEGIPDKVTVWMSHGDHIETPPAGFVSVASSDNSPVAAMFNENRMTYGVQFHPEVQHTELGTEMLRNFAVNVCGCTPNWTSEAFIETAVKQIQEQVGPDGRVLLGLSGGVDSSVVAALVHRAIGDRLTSVFINTGLLRQGEAFQVIDTFRTKLKQNLLVLDATEDFFETLTGVTEPEEKRILIGNLFVRLFEQQARKIEGVRFLAQGTIYPDVIESAAPDRPGARKIKSHHNVGGLPEDMELELVEPLRYLFKDEVRRVGENLGLPEEIVWRQPFPGPGLAIRCLGPLTWERIERLRKADAIFREELKTADMLRQHTSQSFAVLLPVQSVGVMGDGRTYAETVALRAISTDDFMTADWARLPYDLLATVSARIVNEVEGVNRVVYDVTSKPPATIEWE